MAQIKLGELLVRANVLQESQLKTALAEQQRWGGKLGEILVRMGLLSEDLLAKALSKQLTLPIANLDALQELPPQVRRKIPPATVRDSGVLPIQLTDDGRTLVVVMADPLNVQLQDDLRALTRCRIQVQIASRSALQRAFTRFYGGDPSAFDQPDADFKVMDAQGRTLVKASPEIKALQAAARAEPIRTPQPAPRAAPVAQRTAPTAPPVAGPSPTAAPTRTPAEILHLVEETQRKEVAALKAMVELMIEKRVFTREEYLAKVKR